MKRYFCFLFIAMINVAYGAPWTTTQWEVRCGPDIEAAYPAQCDSSNPDSVVEQTRLVLEELSAWVESLGFPQLDVRASPEGKYVAHFRLEDSAFYHLPWGSPAVHDSFDLSPQYFIVEALDLGHGSYLASVLPKEHGIVHTFAHALQASSDGSFSDFGIDGFGREWFFEGTAEAITLAWFMYKSGSDDIIEPDEFDLAYRLFWYNFSRTPTSADFNSYYFWLHVGKKIGSAGLIAYLADIYVHDIYSHDHAPGYGSLQNPLSEIKRAHEVLMAYDPAGLYNLYPEFIATDSEPSRWFPYHEAYRNERLTMTASPSLSAEYTGPLFPLESNAMDLEIDPNGWAQVEVAISLGGPVPEDLHLSVNGIRYDAASLGAMRNRYRFTLTTSTRSSLSIRITDIGPEIDMEPQYYTLRVELAGIGEERPTETLPVPPTLTEPLSLPPAPTGEGCREELLGRPLYSSEAITRAGIADIIEQRARLVATDTRNVVYRLGQGRFSINGDGGDACVSHFAVSDVEWVSDRDPNYDYDAAAAEIIDRYMPRAMAASGLTESQIRNIIDGNPTTASDAQLRNLLEVLQQAASEVLTPDAANSGVFFHIFAPNLVPAMFGGIDAPDYLNRTDRMRTQHDGIGGWRHNSAANLIIYMPGVAASDIVAGNTYPALSYAMHSDDIGPIPTGPETTNALYSVWSGAWERFTCNGQSRDAFTGNQSTIWGQLRGTVTITNITQALISGEFSLTGNGKEDTSLYSVKPNQNPGCPYYGDEAVDMVSVALSASGSFSAPNYSGPGTILVSGQGRAAHIDP